MAVNSPPSSVLWGSPGCGRFSVMIAAIEIGMERSAAAFSSIYAPSKVSALPSIAGRQFLYQWPSAFLFSRDESVHSFGLEAEEYYAELEDNSEQHDWVFFKRLDCEPDPRSVVNMKDVNGRVMASKKVYSAVLRHLHDKLYDECSVALCGVDKSDMGVVLIIPEHWKDETRLFIMNAAEEAGIERGNLGLLTRPTAQLIYINTQLVPKADKYIILDLGECTLSAHVYSRQVDGSFLLMKRHENHTKAVFYRERIRQWLAEILGRNVYDEICNNHPSDLYDFDTDFTIRMMTVRSCASGLMVLRIPIAFSEIFRERTGKELESAMPAGATYSSCHNKIRLPFSFFERIWESYLERTSSIIAQLVQDNDIQGKSTHVFMTGYVSESELVTQRLSAVVSKHITNAQIHVIEEQQLHALKGGIIWGSQDAKPDSHRVWRYSYCVTTGMLLKQITKQGQDATSGPFTIKLIVPTKPGQSHIELHVIATNRTRPLFEDPATDLRIGTVVVNVPPSAPSRKIDIEICIELLGTELAVTAKELISNRCYSKRLRAL